VRRARAPSIKGAEIVLDAGAKLVKADDTASSAVIHVIDAVLVPPSVAAAGGAPAGSGARSRERPHPAGCGSAAAGATSAGAVVASAAGQCSAEK
jgi:hypothetical protein